MSAEGIHAVTGAFGYSGRYIARRLLARGCRVITLTNSFHRVNPFGGEVKAYPFDFDRPQQLVKSLEGVKVLYNTYWVRFNYGASTHAGAVRNSEILFRAARQAGVRRVVHVSITNPSETSDLAYFSGKACVEKSLRESGISYAIVRPAVLFGKEDILINNIAWILRHFPVFCVFGDGVYKLQPIYVDDLAELAVREGASCDNCIVNAIGPETFTYRGLVEQLAAILGTKRLIVSMPPWLGYGAGRLIGKLTRDIVLTREEIAGLMANLLYVDALPAGTTKLTDWAKAHASTLGLGYTSELARRRDRRSAYRSN